MSYALHHLYGVVDQHTYPDTLAEVFDDGVLP